METESIKPSLGNDAVSVDLEWSNLPFDTLCIGRKVLLRLRHGRSCFYFDCIATSLDLVELENETRLAVFKPQ